MQRRTLQFIHLSGTALFSLSVLYIAILALRQAGAHWWLIFSLSGPSIVIAFILISIYLFAIYRSAVRSNEQAEMEHPLTSSSYYMVFYDLSPFLGGLGAVMGMYGTIRATEYFLGIAYGILAATFLVWIIIDPMIGLFENMMPTSRRHRHMRQDRIRELKKQKQHERKQLLASVQAEKNDQTIRWKNALEPQAIELVNLLVSPKDGHEKKEGIAVDIGINAWKAGGLICMEQLHQMTQEQYKERIPDQNEVDYISLWWDGIGQWHHKPYSTRG